ncbi:MAG: fibrobacter succinogenes major paralogous domain-containing protein [Ignavibacteriae bacterium]|jgi:uncharacterized protein (TIGR02145 family)|nr:fibrobacter succinogenes major paralogous domain-containing protein [Ignavibacteriota bacterium]
MKQANKILITVLAVFLTFLFGVSISLSQVTDKDGSTYKTIAIGKQIWLAENLYVSHYRNGDPVPQVQDEKKWENLSTGAWCYYENNTENGKIYGKLYNYYAVVDPRGLAPEGWHMPTDAEWTELTDFSGGEEIAGGKLKAVALWQNRNTGATNESGFSALPGGVRYAGGSFFSIGTSGYFWSASGNYGRLAWIRFLSCEDPTVLRSDSGKRNGMSVRCVKD